MAGLGQAACPVCRVTVAMALLLVAGCGGAVERTTAAAPTAPGTWAATPSAMQRRTRTARQPMRARATLTVSAASQEAALRLHRALSHA